MTPLQPAAEAVESSEVPASLPAPSACLSHGEQCPLCGDSNQCRVARGELYKGPCWCHEITVPQHILTQLAAERLEPACLCRPCLESVAKISSELDDTDAILVEIQKAILSRRAQPDERDFYLDETGNIVFTATYHLKRGNCCENGCRHCPY
jgi:hypothetical protein